MRLATEDELRKSLFGRRVLIDTNAVIYLTEEVPDYSLLARFVFRGLEEGEFTGVLSALTIGEVMMGPLRAGKIEIARSVAEYLTEFPNTTCQAVDEGVLSTFGSDPRILWGKLRATDGLILASGLRQNADRVLSNDLRWRSAVSPDLLVTFEREEPGDSRV